jgi:uncharacterized protein (DUF1697 family)
MKTYISILRGINVSGQKIIKMESLREICEALGFSEVRTYIQSGNIIFSFAETDEIALGGLISGAIQKKFGFEVPVIVLTANELKEVLECNPFKDDPEKEISFLHITFLSSVPQNPDLLKIDEKKFPGEEFSLKGRVVYLYLPKGYGTTKLSNAFIEKVLGVTATTRNLKTSLELFRMTEK